jgi:hypothetical protein
MRLDSGDLPGFVSHLRIAPVYRSILAAAAGRLPSLRSFDPQ